ncbi:hypothetical protein [Bifidobacterium myosotis]|uniref:Uncharacterized protein n=1 Tax=Bifidobacterium myosotis TaxID=1630166 RepID=A0A5M9ZG97_9BIFI|nr:hypothetical protein [Bifidobacterium myosotis]KAA8825089.1 hypothetical protein EMO91_12740 [Bifidobacterium myosotis]
MVMDRNNMSHRPAGTPDGGRFDGRGGGAGADDVEPPAPAPRPAGGDAADTVYPTRGDALAAAIADGADTDGTGVYRLGDGWGVSRTEAHDTESCEIAFDADGRTDLSDAYFSPAPPDAWTAVPGAPDARDWRTLPPVADFLDGDEDSVHVFALKPRGVHYGRDGETEMDASGVTVLCAVRDLAPQWRDGLGYGVVGGVKDATFRRGVDVWPAPGGGASIGDRDHVRATVRRVGGECEIVDADGTAHRVPAEHDAVERGVAEALARAERAA